MPTWLQWLVWIGGGIAAAAIIWTKALRPLFRLIAQMEEMVPLLVSLTEQLKDSPQAFEVLQAIIAQFRSDSGSSLRDVVDRLEKAAVENKEAAKAIRVKAEILEVGVEAVKQLSISDRAAFARMAVAVELLTSKVDHRQDQHDAETKATLKKLEDC